MYGRVINIGIGISSCWRREKVAQGIGGGVLKIGKIG